MSEQNQDILDLNSLSPIPKIISLNGKKYECLPLTLQQLIDLVRFEQALREIRSMDELEKISTEALAAFIPAIKEEGLIFTLEQLFSIIEFAQKTATPRETEEGAKVAKEYSPKKKESSPKE
jgi:hypothetical protein